MNRSPRTRPRLDRLHADRHDQVAMAGRWEDSHARVLLIDDADRVDVDGTGRLVTHPVDRLRDPERDFLLGTVEGQPWYVRRADEVLAQDLRRADLPADQRELAWAGLATLNWHESTPACPVCGGPTRVSGDGPVRGCVHCGHQVFPRTDPAIITAVLDADDRVVLARQARWPRGRFSVLAGFVEVGEPAEHAVAREVMEETGVPVSATRFVASQPWPFPRSLMLGFVTRAAGQVSVDGEELVEGDWYTRDEVRSLVEAGRMTLPGPMSIARRLIDDWLSDQLPLPESGTRFMPADDCGVDPRPGATPPPREWSD